MDHLSSIDSLARSQPMTVDPGPISHDVLQESYKQFICDFERK